MFVVCDDGEIPFASTVDDNLVARIKHRSTKNEKSDTNIVFCDEQQHIENTQIRHVMGAMSTVVYGEFATPRMWIVANGNI